MTLFSTRSGAARAAQRAGHDSFMTLKLHEGWRFHPMKPVPGLAEYAAGKDFVAWTEVHHIDEGRTPGLRGVLIVSCFKDELPGDLPSDYAVQPQTPELWDGSKGSTTGKSTVAGPRAKSEVESPTKLVWHIADDMKGASRAEVVAACVAAGVNKSTAGTQYYRWQKAQSV